MHRRLLIFGLIVALQVPGAGAQDAGDDPSGPYQADTADKSSDVIEARLPVMSEDAELEGLYRNEMQLLDAIASRNLLDLADKLRAGLAELDTFRLRRDYLTRELGKFEYDLEELKRKGFVNEAKIDYLLNVAKFYGQQLKVFYGARSKRGDVANFDPNGLTPEQKREFGIPLTEDEKAASGLEDYTRQEKECCGIPFTAEEFAELHPE
jgi:hypothetical protein